MTADLERKLRDEAARWFDGAEGQAMPECVWQDFARTAAALALEHVADGIILDIREGIIEGTMRLSDTERQIRSLANSLRGGAR